MLRVVLCTAVAAAALVLGGQAPAAAAADKCRTGASAISDTRDIAAVRGAIDRACPCEDFDGTTPATNHGAYVKCAKAVIGDATDGTPLLGAFTLRKQCKAEVKKIHRLAACGYAPARVMC